MRHVGVRRHAQQLRPNRVGRAVTPAARRHARQLRPNRAGRAVT